MRKKAPKDRPPLGVNTTVNGTHLAVFRHGAKAYAMDGACPHAGGDLVAGDIEDLDGQLCVACPVHGFMFGLEAGGVSLVPEGNYQLAVYSTKVDATGTLHVALPGGLRPSMFEEDF